MDLERSCELPLWRYALPLERHGVIHSAVARHDDEHLSGAPDPVHGGQAKREDAQ